MLTAGYLRLIKGGMKGFSLVLRRWLPVGLWAGLVLYASTSIGSGENTSHVLLPFLKWIWPDFAPASMPEINFLIRKTAHVVQFVVYAALLWRGLRLPPPLAISTRAVLAWVLGSSAALGFLSEGIQLFYPQRGARFADVGLDFSGSVIGAGLVLSISALVGRRGRSKPAPEEKPHTKILITSDLHLDAAADSGHEILRQVGSRFLQSKADVLLVAGDFGVAERAEEWMAGLREAAGKEAVLVICLGNHDHWLHGTNGGCLTPEDVREKFWRPACAAHRIYCLDFENVSLPGITLCGGYGHYDFGFRGQDVLVDSKHPATADYQCGRFGGLVYPDMERIPGLALAEEAAQQTKAISRRLAQACDEAKPVLFATHTIPFSSLNHHEVPRDSPRRFFAAYSGNSAIGSLLSAMASSVTLAVCGHTHCPTSVLRIHGIPCINTGSGPDGLRFLLFDLDTRSVAPFGSELQSR
jgi:VanZ family protein/predicted phosphodiesterase